MKSAIDELIREAFSALQHDSSPDEEAHRHLENVLRKQFSATLKKHKADRIADLERQLVELTQENEAICAQNQRFADQLVTLIDAQPTAQQVESARDAERYRAMKEHDLTDLYEQYMVGKLNGYEWADLDKEIDAALQAGKDKE